MKMQNRVIWLLTILKFVFPFLLQHGMYEPHRDEFLYLAEGKHMAWGFMEVPPLLSVFAWLVHLGGDSLFWIKCWPSLFGAATFFLVARMIVSLGGKTFALVLGLLPFIFGGYLRVHFLFQPNFLEIFFWTMIAWSMLSYFQTRKLKWLYIFGLAVGFGMLSKYSVVFFVVSILGGVLFSNQRSLFRNKHLYLALLLSFIIFLPNLIWQYQLHFPVIYHMRELQQTQLQYISAGSFLTDQVIMILPCFFIWMAGLISAGFSSRTKDYRFIALAYIFIIAILLMGHGKNYYSLGAYPVLIAFGSVYLEQCTALRLKPLRIALLAFPLALGLYFIPIALPIYPPEKLARYYEEKQVAKTGVLKWEDQENHPLPQDFADMLGWEEMAAKMAAAYQRLDSNEKKHTLLFCDNYGEAGALNFYAHKYQLPEIYSDNASFLNWMPKNFTFNNIVLVTDDKQEMHHPFINNFKLALATDSVTNPFAREHGSLVVLLKAADTSFQQFFIDKIEKDKAKVKW